VILRTAIPDDEAAVLRLVEELFEPPGRRPPGYSPERASTGFQHAVAEPHADVLLALDGDALIGFASVYAEFPSIRFGRRCWLEDLVVTSRTGWRRIPCSSGGCSADGAGAHRQAPL